MRKVPIILLFMMLLCACGETLESTYSSVSISWADFVKINDQEYGSLYTVAISDDKYIGDQIAQVEFKVDDNITDSHYQIKNGDAAFWDEGTPIYEVKGMPSLLAIEDMYSVNGYQIYELDDEPWEKWTYDKIDPLTIDKVEIIKGYVQKELTHTLEGEEINEFRNILEQGEEVPDYSANTLHGDPQVYFILFYTDSPIVHYYQLEYDGDEWYWFQREMEILPDEIKNYIN